ncbi:hypothetical protein EDB19DRAFT_1959962 [Suillus lakei]|nr:hypothetical protein EDB19DRAFT_1959962 [Suillus lakei]
MAVSDGLFTYMWADHISASKDSKATAKLQSTPSNTPHSVALSNTPVALIQIQHLPVLPQSTSSSSSSSSSAQTYERITSFPDGYEMKVGEMVEGEKQYVTIVRTGKNPKDETNQLGRGVKRCVECMHCNELQLLDNGRARDGAAGREVVYGVFANELPEPHRQPRVEPLTRFINTLVIVIENMTRLLCIKSGVDSGHRESRRGMIERVPNRGVGILYRSLIQLLPNGPNILCGYLCAACACQSWYAVIPIFFGRKGAAATSELSSSIVANIGSSVTEVAIV